MPKLVGSRYGKGRVRVLKILREGKTHRLKEVNVLALMKGDFASSYTEGDNTKVVATDTIKNTINALAKDHLGDEIERFGIFLAQHFVVKYPQIQSAEIEILERHWERMNVDGSPHPHSFLGNDASRGFARVTCEKEKECVVESGVRDLIILKSTESGFENYPKDEFTTLKETSDRILGTSFGATWRYEKTPQNFAEANNAILNAMLKVFAENFSPSAQTTLYQMGEAALAVWPEISRLELAMPNKHCLLIDLSPFGMKNANEVFLPIDEPHGQIEATMER
jgi:urate oxidase